MTYQERVKEHILKWLNQLQRAEKEEMLYLVSRWQEVEKVLSEMILDLAQKEGLSRNQLYRLEEYQKFLNELQRQIKYFSLDVGQKIIQQQKWIGGFEIIPGGLSLRQGNLWIGLSREGTPIYELLKESYPETVIRITNTLLEGISLGYAPEKTARLMREDLAGNLSRALRIARTEQMNTFREVSRMQMEQAGVDSWEWLAEEDACDFCLSQAGKRFPTEQGMETHPNCRCAMLPVIEKRSDSNG
ncbi:phage putative head morphogenesis protein, SPP1 gp7 family [Anaerolinea thermolimosa]|uniref:minor capsid protein n=1 Tax=Anaerolinea thermolimosa TaxID=229919 RepID=UPI000783BBDC|nr:minor capsid protein [Anaerolinea thermolimosa]GAP07119.1 phage putative head morphogenesis protein, SPP1 gp7 family [Anaerolinea thermolimosa]